MRAMRVVRRSCAAPSPAARSGWCSRASSRQRRLISSGDASRGTSRMRYGSPRKVVSGIPRGYHAPGSAIDLPRRPGIVAHAAALRAPLEPMLAKARGRDARRRRLAVRAQVGWLPRDRVPRRRRGLSSRAATSSRSIATSRSSRSRSAASLPERCVVDGEVVIAGDGRPRLRGAAAAHPSRGVAGRDARRAVAGLVRRLGPAGARRRGPARTTPGGAPRAAGGGARGRRGAGPPDARDARSRRRRRTGSSGSRAPASTASSPSPSMARTSRASGRCSRSSTSARPTAWWPASAGTRTGPGPIVGSLLLGPVRRRAATLHHVGVTSSFTWERRAQLVDELAPLRERRARRPPWGEMGRMGGDGPPTRRASGCRAPPAAGTAARTCRGSRCGPSASCEVAYDHLQGDRFRHGTTFQRWRPDKQPDRLPIRPAGGDDTLRAGSYLRARPA